MITIAICTWNRCELLRATLDHMTKMAPPPTAWEILVIDNNCTDATQEVVRSFASVLPLRVISEPNPGLSNARNRALRESKSDLIIYTDDDVLVHEQWLVRFWEAAGKFPEAGAFGGGIDPWFPIAPDPDLVEAFPSLKNGFCGLNYDMPEGELPAGKEIYGANIGFRRSAIGDLKFDPTLGPNPFGAGRVGDETEFVERMRKTGRTAIWVPSMRVQHYVDPKRMTLAYLCEFSDGGGRTWIRWNGVPPGGQIAGAPLWLWRKSGEAWVRSKLLAVSGRRQDSLRQLREHHYLRGMIHECRAIAREKGARAVAAPAA